MLIRCVESSTPVVCACNILIGHALVFVLVCPAFPSFHPLRSQVLEIVSGGPFSRQGLHISLQMLGEAN
jgi:hypothetical protein